MTTERGSDEPGPRLIELQAECDVIEKEVARLKLMTPGDMDAHRPGGHANSDTGWRGTLYYYRTLHRAHAKLQWQALSQQQRTGALEDDAITLDALRGAPQSVELLAPDDRGRRVHVHVHPKAFNALVEMHRRDLLIRWLVPRVHYLRDSPRADDIALAQRALREWQFQQLVMIWIVTTPGPRLPWATSEQPFGVGVTTLDDVPERVRDQFGAIDALDIYRVLQAHTLVNSARLHAINSLLPAPPSDTPVTSVPPSWSVFWGTLPDEMGNVHELMNDVSLGSILARVKVDGTVQRTLYDEASARAKQEQPV